MKGSHSGRWGSSGRRTVPPPLWRVQAGIDALGEDVGFLIVYYGSDKYGGWQSLDLLQRNISMLGQFGLGQWKDGFPTSRMLQVSEFVSALGLTARKPARGPNVPFKVTAECNRWD
ncbi:hypothetical protein [Methylobacterium sp. D54C]